MLNNRFTDVQRRPLLLMFGACATRPASALYDPKPLALLEVAAGTWAGTLTYRDYAGPQRMVTLKTVLRSSLVAPDELALYYVFDDGPAKMVYSYERLKLDLAEKRVVWTSGINKPDLAEYQITASLVQEDLHRLSFERTRADQTDDYLLEVSKQRWLLTKHESSGGAPRTLRSKYEFTRRQD